MVDDWLLIKRGLFYRPNSSGYTGIRDEAGLYSKEVADEHAAAGGTVMLAADAPEFMPVAYNDLVIKHLTAQLDSLRNRVTVLEMVITEELNPFDCQDAANEMIVLDIHKRDAAGDVGSPQPASGTQASEVEG